jgi:hypothetical protein
MHNLHWSAKFFLAIGACVASLVVLLLAFEVKDVYDSYYPGFNKQEWLSHSNSITNFEPNPRDQMVPNIIAHKLEKGMSKQAVVALLGPPDSGNLETDSVLRYQTGWDISDSGSNGPFYLVLNFRNNRHLSRAQCKACSSIFTTCEIE